LGQPGHVRFSTLESPRSGDQEIGNIQVQDAANSSVLEEKELVSISLPHVNGKTNQTTKQTRSTSSREKSVSMVSRRGRSRVTRLDFIRAAYKRKKFPDKVIDRLVTARKAKSEEIYQCKWDIFVKWCNEKGIIIENVAVQDLAEFINFQFEQGKAISTIKGYITAVVGTLQVTDATNKFTANDLVLSQMLRSFYIERPIRNNAAPKWNLAMVLYALTKHPFEPCLEVKSIDIISRKTFFLILLATAKRRGHIYNLDYDQLSFAEDKKSISIGVFPEFIAKTEIATGKPVDKTVHIPALTSASSQQDSFLCPVRALKKYLAVTRKIRRKRRRLFLPLCPSKDDFGPGALTGWIKALITYVYQNCSESQAQLFRCAHEVRALSTTWASINNVAMTSILKAAQWSSHTTFTNHYLKDLTNQKGDLLELGPLVVAETVV
jgi:hypothetical protein